MMDEAYKMRKIYGELFWYLMNKELDKLIEIMPSEKWGCDDKDG